MKHRQVPRRKHRHTKSVLRLLDLEHAKSAPAVCAGDHIQARKLSIWMARVVGIAERKEFLGCRGSQPIQTLRLQRIYSKASGCLHCQGVCLY
jgi:hypothetical protein